MKHIEITPSCDGLWMYTVYINGRITIVGLSQSRERAERAASTV